MFNPKIPKFWRYGMPVILLLNMGCFIIANVQVGVEVRLKMKVNDGAVIHEDLKLKTFNLISSVKDMWDAKVYPLSILIALFSGIWPYTKLILMFLCWVIPQRVLPFKRREILLEILDTMGKYSLIDSYVLVMMTVSFNYILNLDLVVAKLGIEEVVRVKSAFYLFLIITITSLIWTHIILFYHRKVEEKLTKFSEEKLSLGDQYCNQDKQWFRKNLKYLTVGILAICFILLLWGASIDSFQFDFLGLAGFMLGPTANKESFSLIALGKLPPSDTTGLTPHTIAARASAS